MIVALALGFFWLSRNRGHLIDASEARRLVGSGASLVDVRTPAEYSGGHIDGAVNIPLNQVESRIADFGERSSPIVLYCRSGARSGKALQILQSKGFTQVHNLGGIGNW